MSNLPSQMIRSFAKYWHQPQWALLVCLGVLLLGNYLIYFDFILTDRLFLFYDAGSDSVSQLLPFIDYFANVRDITALWEHRTGLGNNQFLMSALYVGFDPILLMFRGSDPESIGAHLEWFAIIKSLIAGSFFFGFLRLRRFSTFTSLVGGCCWGMAGMFVAIATWFVSMTPSHSAALAMVLWGYQYWRNGKSPVPLVLAFSYYLISTQAFVTLPQLGVFFFLFMAYDWWQEVDPRPTFIELCQRYLKFGLYCGWGLLLVAPLLLPTLYYIFFENSRMSSEAGPSLFELPHWVDFFANFTRLFSNDLFGTANAWGEQVETPDYLMMPFNYFGIIWVILIPVCLVAVFRKGGREEKSQLIKLLVFCLPFVVVLLMPGIRSYLFYGGKVDYYRWVCNYSGIAYLLIGAYCLDWVLQKGLKSFRWLPLVMFGIVLILLFSLIYYLSQYRGLSPDLWTMGIVFVGLLGATLALSLRSVTAVYVLLSLVIFSDLTIQGNRTASTLRKSLWTIEKRPEEPHLLYSNPDMLAALADIKGRETSPFYRVSKAAEYGAKWDNSSLSHDYMGTRAYHSFNNKNVVEFYYAFTNHEPGFWGTVALPGFDGFGLLDSFLGVKYYATFLAETVPDWATEINRFGDVVIYENAYAYPLATPYYQYANSSLLESEADRIARQQFIINTVLLDETEEREDLASLREVKSIASEWPDAIKTRRLSSRIVQNKAFSLTHFEQDVVEGIVELDKPAVLVFSIPFDPGWKAWVNEKSVVIERANLGFIGLPLGAGESTVRLSYWPPFLTLGIVLSTFGIAAFLIIPRFCFKRRTGSQ